MSPRGDDKPLQNLRDRIRELEANERSEVSNAVPTGTFANLPAAGQAGRGRFVSDGRKMGEGPGAGTGVPVYDDGGASWRRYSDDTVVVI
jgi:hypothetical protein